MTKNTLVHTFVTLVTINRPDSTSTPIIKPTGGHILTSTRLPGSNLPLKNVQITVPTRRQIPSGGIDQWPHGPQASSITVPIRDHAAVLLKEFDDLREPTVDGILIARAEILTLIVHTGKLRHPNWLSVLGPVVPHIVHHSLGRILVRMDACVVPRWLRHPKRLHERCEPILIQLRSHGGRADEGSAAHFAESIFPGGRRGGRIHVAGVRGLPVRLVESHHVSRGRGSWEGFEGVVAICVIRGGVADGGGSVGFVEIAITP